MTDLTLEAARDLLRDELHPIRDELQRMRVPVDGIPTMNRNLTVLQQETRAIRAAVNDLARIQVTSGEIEALHADVNRVQAEYAELATRLATLERLFAESRRES
jgi:ubiquinone biosynthesis protein UbiJ